MTFSAKATLSKLKDFQRRTVDHAFNRLFLDNSPVRRFLVADEVGLGKTLVARGVIARTVELLQKEDKRIDVIYICSNQDIAVQNVGRLAIHELSAFKRATRLTLLPLQMSELSKNRLNFISFTPGTTFDPSNRTGVMEERRLIYHMLREMPELAPRGLRRAMRGSADYKRWMAYAEDLTADKYDKSIAARFRERLKTERKLFAQVCALTEEGRLKRERVTTEEHERHLEVIGQLRRLLARTCLDALEPDLVILDEFQRFGELLEEPPTTEAAVLAHDLFNYSDGLRILLLSATPYRMYATADENEDHYGEFLKTVRFLLRSDEAAVERLKADLTAYRSMLVGIGARTDLDALYALKARIESCLRAVMCRTERVRSTTGANSMVRYENLAPALMAEDLREFRQLERLSRRLAAERSIDFWKSSPYLLNFMREYKLKDAVSAKSGQTDDGLAAYAERFGQQLTSARIRKYKALEANNPRLRSFVQELRDEGLFDLVWMPPSLAYWKPGGAYANTGLITKHLVFSAWNVVPDALSVLLSYEAERTIVIRGRRAPDYDKLADRMGPRLTFSMKDGRPGGMLALMLVYPSATLAELVDPLALCAEDGEPLAYENVVEQVEQRLAPLVAQHVDHSNDFGPEDVRWYWVVLAALEQTAHPASAAWSRYVWASADDDGETTNFAAHARLWASTMEGERPPGIGRVPKDLVSVLAHLALAGPGVCALRSVRRRWGFGQNERDFVATAAANIAAGLRSQFNSPRVVALLHHVGEEESYWRRVLQYSSDGNLQAVMDEYMHIAAENSAHDDDRHPALVTAAVMQEALTLRAATPRPDEMRVEEGRFVLQPLELTVRSHFAVRYGASKDEEKQLSRKESVQAAFNSPFWPFVLASTSVGQEGLDFHGWCHSVVHWNLPSNPVDLEQREGRVHRYKGHAVRRNVALRYGATARQRAGQTRDPWEAMFDMARVGKPPGISDLVPYWVFEVPGGAVVRRRVMALPLSRDDTRYRRLQRSLAIYRLAFAQPRQDDLLACLQEGLHEGITEQQLGDWVLNLQPPRDVSFAVEMRAHGLKHLMNQAEPLVDPGAAAV
jgi:hypothetical protein